MALLENLCTVLDQMKEGRYTLREVVTRSQELDPPIDLDQKNIGTSMAALAHIGALKSSHIPGEGVAKHYERVLEGSFLEALKQGKFQGLYTKYRGATPTRPRRAQVEPEPEVEQEPEPEQIELDAIEICKSLGREGFMEVFWGYVEETAADARETKAENERLKEDYRYLQGQRVGDERAAQSRVNELNEQLRAERELVMNLRGEISTLRGRRVTPEAEPRIIYQREVGPGGMQHGASVGGSPSREVRHGPGPKAKSGTQTPPTVVYKKR